MVSRMAPLMDEAGTRLRDDAVEILDAHTLRLRLSRPDISIIPSTADYPAAIVHPSFTTAEDFLANPVGTGPYLPTRHQVGIGGTLERAPDHYNGRSRLAQLELLSGSPARAAELYEELVGRSGETAELSNLGTAHLLLGDAERAARRFREAFELAPSSPQVALNLADAELLRERREEAEKLYRRVIELIDRDPNPEGLLTVRAQALAHLGRVPEAVAAVQEALRRNPESPAASYEAALVYTLVGDEASALWNAQRALEQGVEPRWFTFPWFDPLRPGLEELTEAAGG